MGKRLRRRAAVVLESDDEDEAKDDTTPASKSHALHLTSVLQGGERAETNPKRKLQKSSQQPGVNSLFESRWKITNEKVLRETFPLDVITLPAASTEDSSRTQKAGLQAKLGGTSGNYQKPVHEQYLDHRLWVDKYAPTSVGDLVVHKKKVSEVKEWLEGQLLNPYGSHLGSRVLLLTGPAGVGKTAVVKVLADLLGIGLLEWATPTPELWQEYSHHAASGWGPYVSKLDEFEAFLERGRKMSSLPLVSVASSHNVKPFSGVERKTKDVTKVLLIDDLPFVSNRDHYQRLARSFYHLAVSRNFPTIVVMTDETGSGNRLGKRDYEYKDVLEALETGGAKKIAFNPVSVNAMNKLLHKVQFLEKCRLSSESLSDVAESSSGDIRQALTSLQFLFLGCHSHNLHMWDPGGVCSSKSIPRKLQANEKNSQETTVQENKSCASVGGGRDYSLSLFHALGKILHNKRHADELLHSGKNMKLKLKDEFRRHSLNMQEPEVVLSQAHTETATFLAFIHENVLQFVDEDAADDVAAISAYLSDADCLLGAQGIFHSKRTLENSNDVYPLQVRTAVANSVAARGVLFGNGHPAPRRWQSIRAPALWQVERQKRLKKVEITTHIMNGIFEFSTLSGLVQAMEHPLSQRLYRHTPPSSLAKVFNAAEIVEIEDSMELDEHNQENCPDLQQQAKMGALKQEHFECNTTFMQLCVEDDIEDLEDSEDSEDLDPLSLRGRKFVC